MIEVESAVELIGRHFVKMESEAVLLDSLIGRVLAENIYASREQPPFDRVAMDGIAIFSEKTQLRSFKIAGIQRAGQPQESLLDKSNAIEVMTGAMLPKGSNTVIPYEQFELTDGVATLNESYEIKDHSNIHFQGSDHSEGNLLLKSGAKLSSAAIALIAGQGQTKALVYKIPKIAVISTGDELIVPGENCEPWQIWRSNPYAIYSELLGLNSKNTEIDLFHLSDNEDEMQALLTKVLKSHQILILSGGVSMGKYDFVHTIMDKLGVKKIFHKVKQRPGKPLYFGVGELGQNVFGLPGNPVSALVCMRRYVISALENAMMNSKPKANVILSEDISFKKDFTLFKAVNISSNEEGHLIASPIFSNGSGDFTGLGNSDGFIELPSNKTLYKKGEVYPYYSWLGLNL